MQIGDTRVTIRFRAIVVDFLSMVMEAVVVDVVEIANVIVSDLGIVSNVQRSIMIQMKVVTIELLLKNGGLHFCFINGPIRCL